VPAAHLVPVLVKTAAVQVDCVVHSDALDLRFSLQVPFSAEISFPLAFVYLPRYFWYHCYYYHLMLVVE
jgi:hypothetical protein